MCRGCQLRLPRLCLQPCRSLSCDILSFLADTVFIIPTYGLDTSPAPSAAVHQENKRHIKRQRTPKGRLSRCLEKGRRNARLDFNNLLIRKELQQRLDSSLLSRIIRLIAWALLLSARLSPYKAPCPQCWAPSSASWMKLGLTATRQQSHLPR